MGDLSRRKFRIKASVTINTQNEQFTAIIFSLEADKEMCLSANVAWISVLRWHTHCARIRLKKLH